MTRKSPTQETKDKIRLSQIGRKFTDEHREKLRQAHLGVKLSPKHREGVIKTLKPMQKGETLISRYGVKKANEIKEKYRLAKLGKKAPWNAHKNHRGEKHYKWIKDRTHVLEKHKARSSKEWKDWRTEVFIRDGYTCQECSTKGVYLEPHHIVPIRSDWNQLFNTKNGITLCRPCHKKTMWKESEFQERYILKVELLTK